jgi:Plant transposon protein
MRRPNIADIERLLHMGQQREFAGMLGSIDCMH